MNKRLFLTLAAVAAIAIGVVGMSAFEAHIINVTAQIENALQVPLQSIDFGTVFPQEQLDQEITFAMSSSFVAENDADGVTYVIKQKPKCILSGAIDEFGVPVPGFDPGDEELYGSVTEDAQGIFECAEGYTMLKFLCPYLSKHDADPADQNDYELDAFHGPIASWTNADATEWAVNGRLAKSEEDVEDMWNIDLKVPCFEGQCAQDWADYVTGINPLADPAEYVQPVGNEHALFGCDLWVEVTGVQRLGEYSDSLTLENKDENYNWMIEQDDFKATMLYNASGDAFDFELSGKVMHPDTDYRLIYYADKPGGDWGGDNPGALIASFTSDGDGNIFAQGSVDLGMDLPHPDDINNAANPNHGEAFVTGAKIWVVPAADYDDGNLRLTTWNTTEYLYEYQTILYDDTNWP